MFLAGISIVTLGSFVMLFDYPQIAYMEEMQNAPSGSVPFFDLQYRSTWYLEEGDQNAQNEAVRSNEMLYMQERALYDRLVIEFAVGAGITILGAVLIAGSFRDGFAGRLSRRRFRDGI